MALADIVAALLSLRTELSTLLEEDDWSPIEGTVTAQFERLRLAATPAEQRASIDALADILLRFPALSLSVRLALAAGVSTRGISPGTGTSDPDESSVAQDGRHAVLERWPHIDIDHTEPVPALSILQATVYVDTTPPRPNEEGGSIFLPRRTQVRLRITLVTSEYFMIDGDNCGWIVVTPGDERSTAVVFRLRVVQGARGIGVVTAFFDHDGRPAGSVYRKVAVGAAGFPEHGEDDLPSAMLSADLSARRPDLTIALAAIPGSGRERFTCRVSTPHLREYADGTTEEWDLPLGSTTKNLVLASMAGFTRGGASNDVRRAELVGAGLDFFDAAPLNFKQVYWELRDAGLPINSIFVVSSEPFVPWELMIPSRGGVEDQVPLGVSSAVGRWIHAAHVSPEQRLELQTSHVIAPSYPGKDFLEFSAEEALYVCDSFSGRQISPALYATIDAVLGQGGADLLHLICHGADGPAGGQVLKLDADEYLTDGMLRGMSGLKRAVTNTRPMVFINACQVGRQTPALVGTGGFAQKFIALGARAVVAPIWSVKDDVASNVARTFYQEVRSNPRRPFASILSEIRRRAYQGPDPEDSWAAYCYYGDPLAAGTG